MRISMIAALAILLGGTAFAQSFPPGPPGPPGPPPDFQGMRAEHDRLEAEWAACKALADGTARATCYERVHDESEADMARREAERHSRGGDRPPPPPQ